MRTVGLVLVAVLPALALMLYGASEQRRLDGERALLEAQRQATLTAADQAQQVIGARHVLQLLARQPTIAASDAGACDALLGTLLPRYPSFSNITVMRPDGAVVCSAPIARAGLNLADRAYFRRAVAAREFAAGDYIIGRITGRPTIDFALPVLDRSGRVTQVLALGLDLTWLNTALAGGRWPEGTTLTLADQSGTIVGSFPDAARIGKPVAASFMGVTWNDRQGTARAVNAAGPMLIGYAAADAGNADADVRVIVGIPEAVAFADADRQLARNLVLLGAALALALAAAWALGSRLVVRPVRSLNAVARDLRAGRFGVHAGPPYARGELGVLGHAFDVMTENLKAAYLNTIRVLAGAIGARDPGGLEHVTRVAEYAVGLGRALGWDESRLIRLQMGATLHDVGKIGCPDAVLRKAGALDAEEFDLVRTHPEAGVHVIARVPFLYPASDCVRCHHESYDGSGYPDGMAGDAIPVDARVVAIADAFDAMTAPKPYGQGRETDDALADLDRKAGTSYDPVLVAAFVSAVRGRVISPVTVVSRHAGARA